MIVQDTDVEIKKFKMYAEKADSEQKIMELCKKYLKHKGIDTDAPLVNYFKPQEPKKIYVGMMDIIKVEAQTKVDGIDRSPMQTSQEILYAKKNVIEQITHQLVRDEMIKFDTYQMMDTYQTIVQGKLNVLKESKE